MSLKHEMKWHDWAGVALLAWFGLLAVAYMVVGWRPIVSFLTDSATAAWVQAFGSIGAIVWAVWIATVENRRRAEALNIEAQIVSLAVLGLLQHVRAVVEALAEVLKPLAKFDGAPEGLVSAHDTLNGVLLPTQAQVLALVPVGGGCAKSLAQSIARIELLKGSLRVVVSRGQQHDSDTRKEAFILGYRDLTEVAHRLKRCCVQLEKFNESSGTV